MSRVPVLLYHHLVSGEATLPALPAEEHPYVVDVRRFEAQLEALAAHGYTAVLPDEAYAESASGAARPVVLCFDDNCPSHADLAAPALEALGWRGVFFVVTGRFGRPSGLEADDVRALEAAGHVIGSHTRTHAFLNLLDDASLLEELEGSRYDLSAILGTPPDALSCPGGRYDARVLVAAEAAGYGRVFSSDSGGGDGSFLVGRTCVRRDWDAGRVLAAASGERGVFEGLGEAAKATLRGLLGDRAYDRAQKTYFAIRARGAA